MSGIIAATPAQLRLIKNTVAKDLNEIEFDLFMQRCRSAGLDPFKRQMCAIVYNKDNAERRKVTFITEIAGYRSLAEKAGNYRPAETDDDEVIVTDDLAKSEDSNPLGIVSATYYAYKQDNKGDWHRVRARVYWDEYVPLRPKWENREIVGHWPLEGTSNWRKMGRHMLMKCAEAHCLRKGWPDQIGDLYTRDEMAQADMAEKYDLDLTATEVLDEDDKEQRVALIGGPSINLLWAPGGKLEPIKVGRVADRCFEWIGEQTDANAIRAWQETNTAPLREFWAQSKHDALNVKREAERRIQELET